ncbi:MAG: hypothetical protein J5590_06365 [Clostridia bacterium]|nr:hypothetical protein [Clostridia bacterium]
MLKKERDSKPERAASVKKICLRHIFSEAGAKAGTESASFRSPSSKDAEQLYPFLSATYGITFVYQAKVILFFVRKPHDDTLFRAFGDFFGGLIFLRDRQKSEQRKGLEPFKAAPTLDFSK